MEKGNVVGRLGALSTGNELLGEAVPEARQHLNDRLSSKCANLTVARLDDIGRDKAVSRERESVHSPELDTDGESIIDHIGEVGEKGLSDDVIEVGGAPRMNKTLKDFCDLQGVEAVFHVGRYAQRNSHVRDVVYRVLLNGVTYNDNLGVLLGGDTLFFESSPCARMYNPTPHLGLA